MALNTKLRAIVDTLDKKTGEGRDLPTAVTLATDYVKKHPEEFAEYEKEFGDDLDKTVHAIEVFRDAGMQEKSDHIQIWELQKFERQDIGGAARARVRVVGD